MEILLTLRLTGLTAPNPYQFEELYLFVCPRGAAGPGGCLLPTGLSPAFPRGAGGVAQEQPLL
ncbi:hypothetical protein EK904_011942 [Melospiza melodia maxima]|nr:hypothetical protein EK904_011942 [Melospiza melodia maxima]